MIGGPRKVSNALARWRGFHDALKASGLPLDPELVIEGDYRIESGYRAGHALLSHQPDGIYVANHLMTVGLLKAAEEMGLPCPEDFGLISFDDYPWLGVFRPRLTTVELPKRELGIEAAELLIRRISGDVSKAAVMKLQPELRMRESCGFAAARRAQKIGHRTGQDGKKFRICSNLRASLAREEACSSKDRCLSSVGGRMPSLRRPGCKSNPVRQRSLELQPRRLRRSQSNQSGGSANPRISRP